MGDSIKFENFYKRMQIAALIGEAVSHKINNSLSGILGYIQFAEEKIQKLKEAGVKGDVNLEDILRYLKTSEKEADFSKNLMSELKWFSRLYLERSSGFEDEIKEEDVIDVFHSFWAEVSGKSFFANCTIKWLVDKGAIKIKLSENQLLCVFYITMMCILKYTDHIEEKEKKLVVEVAKADEEKYFEGVKLVFNNNRDSTTEKIYRDFVLIEALIKAVYGKLEIEEENDKLAIILKFSKS